MELDDRFNLVIIGILIFNSPAQTSAHTYSNPDAKAMMKWFPWVQGLVAGTVGPYIDPATGHVRASHYFLFFSFFFFVFSFVYHFDARTLIFIVYLLFSYHFSFSIFHFSFFIFLLSFPSDIASVGTLLQGSGQLIVSMISIQQTALKSQLELTSANDCGSNKHKMHCQLRTFL